MKRLMFRRRPELESLESMVLLSGMVAAEHPHHAAAAIFATHQPVTHAVVSLSGTARGTYRATGSGFTFTGTGTVSPLGHSTLKGSLLIPTGQLTVSTRHGKVFANLSLPQLGAPVSYTITGGTGQFAGASGNGAGILSFVPAHGRAAAHGRFSIALSAAT
jgi:hypothetical protein